MVLPPPRVPDPPPPRLTEFQRLTLVQVGRALVVYNGGRSLSALTPHVTSKALERKGYVEIIDPDGPCYRVLLTRSGEQRAREEYQKWLDAADRPVRRSG